MLSIELIELFGTLLMASNTDHSVALQALGWKPLKTKRKKAKAKVVFKLFNKMGPKSLPYLSTPKVEMTNYNLRNISSGLSYRNQVPIT